MPAVKVVAELDYPGLPRVRPGEPDCHHGRLGPGAVKAQLFDRGHETLHPGRPPDLELGAAPEVGPFPDLSAHRLDYAGVGMTEYESAVPHHVAQVLVAVHIPLARSGPVRGENGEGVSSPGVVGHPAGKNLQRLAVE